MLKLKSKEKLFKMLFCLCAFVSAAAVALICIFMFANGFPAMAENGFFKFLFGEEWRPTAGQFGILPMITGSICVTAGAIIFGVPLGLMCAIFLAGFCPKKLYKVLKPAIDLLAGIPSVVYGYFGLMAIVPIMQDIFGGNGKGILTASILLGFMILPTIISVSEASLRAVPNAYYEGSLALGATHEQSMFKTVFPAAGSGIFAGVILGIGRAIGETMAVAMVAGNSAIFPDSLTSNVRTLTTNIILEMGYATGLHRQMLIATGVVLFIFILIINLCFSMLKRKGGKAQ